MSVLLSLVVLHQLLHQQISFQYSSLELSSAFLELYSNNYNVLSEIRLISVILLADRLITYKTLPLDVIGLLKRLCCSLLQLCSGRSLLVFEDIRSGSAETGQLLSDPYRPHGIISPCRPLSDTYTYVLYKHRIVIKTVGITGVLPLKFTEIEKQLTYFQPTFHFYTP